MPLTDDELYNNFLQAMVYYVFEQTGNYPPTRFYKALANNSVDIQIIAWLSPCVQPVYPYIIIKATYDLPTIQAAYIQYAIQNSIIIIQTELYTPLTISQPLTGTLNQIIGTINNTTQYNNTQIYNISALSCLESSDSGYTIILYDTTRSIVIASDHFTNLTYQWNNLTLLNQFAQNSDTLVEIQALCDTNTSTALIDSISIQYYQP